MRELMDVPVWADTRRQQVLPWPTFSSPHIAFLSPLVSFLVKISSSWTDFLVSIFFFSAIFLDTKVLKNKNKNGAVPSHTPLGYI